MELRLYPQIAPCNDTCSTQGAISQSTTWWLFSPVVLRLEVNICMDQVMKVDFGIDVISKIVKDIIHHDHKRVLQAWLRTIEVWREILIVKGNRDTNFHTTTFMFSWIPLWDHNFNAWFPPLIDRQFNIPIQGFFTSTSVSWKIFLATLKDCLQLACERLKYWKKLMLLLFGIPLLCRLTFIYSLCSPGSVLCSVWWPSFVKQTSL